jgi:hypothetical protein
MNAVALDPVARPEVVGADLSSIAWNVTFVLAQAWSLAAT